MDYLGIGVGDSINIQIPGDAVQRIAANIQLHECKMKRQKDCDPLNYLQMDDTIVSFRIKDSFTAQIGKVGSQQAASTILVEKDHFLKRLSNSINNINISGLIGQANPDHFSDTIIINQKDRIDTYLDSNYDNI